MLGQGWPLTAVWRQLEADGVIPQDARIRTLIHRYLTEDLDIDSDLATDLRQHRDTGRP